MADRCGDQGTERDDRWPVTTLDGHVLDASLDVWTIPIQAGVCVVNLSDLPRATERLREAIREWLAGLLAARPPERAEQFVSRVRVLLRQMASERPDVSIDQLRAEDLLGYQASRPNGDDRRVGPLCEALRSWASSGAGGLAADLLELLPQVEFTAYETGEAVRTASPTDGAMSEAESRAIVCRLRSACGSGSTRLTQHAATLTITMLGLRPLQLALTKCRDVRTSAGPVGETRHELWVTRLKQGVRPGSVLVRYDTTPELASILRLQRDASLSLARTLGLPLDGAALFLPADYDVDRPSLPGWEGHPKPAQVRRWYKATITKLDVTSDQTGGRLASIPRRARRTVVSRAVAAGHDLRTASRLVDQTHPSAALAYVQTTPEHLDRVDRALGGRLAGLGRALMTGEPFAPPMKLPSSSKRRKWRG